MYVGSQASPLSAAGRLDVFPAGGCPVSPCAPVWQGLAGAESILQSSPTVVDGRVYVGAYDGKLYVFDANGCGAPLCPPLWTGATGGHIESSPNNGQVLAWPARAPARSSSATRSGAS